MIFLVDHAPVKKANPGVIKSTNALATTIQAVSPESKLANSAASVATSPRRAKKQISGTSSANAKIALPSMVSKIRVLRESLSGRRPRLQGEIIGPKRLAQLVSI